MHVCVFRSTGAFKIRALPKLAWLSSHLCEFWIWAKKIVFADIWKLHWLPISWFRLVQIVYAVHPIYNTNTSDNFDKYIWQFRKYILLTYKNCIGKLPILMIVHISWFRLQPVCVLCTLSSSYNTPEGLEPQHSILRGTLESETYKHTYKYIQTYLYTWNLDIWAMEDAWIFLWLPSSPHLQINIHHPIPISPHLHISPQCYIHPRWAQ